MIPRIKPNDFYYIYRINIIISFDFYNRYFISVAKIGRATITHKTPSNGRKKLCRRGSRL